MIARVKSLPPTTAAARSMRIRRMRPRRGAGIGLLRAATQRGRGQQPRRSQCRNPGRAAAWSNSAIGRTSVKRAAIAHIHTHRSASRSSVIRWPHTAISHLVGQTPARDRVADPDPPTPCCTAQRLEGPTHERTSGPDPVRRGKICRRSARPPQGGPHAAARRRPLFRRPQPARPGARRHGPLQRRPRRHPLDRHRGGQSHARRAGRPDRPGPDRRRAWATCRPACRSRCATAATCQSRPSPS